MTRSIRLSIPNPCHEDWHAMSNTEQGRFCSSCRKEVIDFSDKTDEELVQFFHNGQRGVCGRFRSSSLDRSILQPEMASSFRMPAFFRTFGALGSLLLLTTQKSLNAAPMNGSVETEQTTVSNKEQPELIPIGDTELIRISGQVTDENNHDRLIGANVMVIRADSNVVIAHTNADIDGNFLIEFRQEDLVGSMQYYLVIQYLGFEEVRLLQSVKRDPGFVSVVMKEAATALAGEVVVVMGKPSSSHIFWHRIRHPFRSLRKK